MENRPTHLYQVKALRATMATGPTRNPTKRFLSFLGPYTTGDVGPFTCYTSKVGKFVVFPRAPPDKPPSAAQIQQRRRLAAAVQNWHNLSSTEKVSWTKLAASLSLVSSGYNLFLSLSLSPDDAALTTAKNRTGISVTTPTVIPP
jgi:hypothetical protein